MFPKFLTTTLTFILLVFYTSSINGQDEKVLVSKKLQKDFKEFQAFFHAHPDPYTHTPKEVFDAKFKEVEASLSKDQTPLEFYKKVASIVALIKDGHSSVYMPRFWLENKRKKYGCFPYEMHLTNDNQLYVLKDLNNGGIKPGTKILAINDVPVDEFLDMIDPYISYERLAFRNTKIDNGIEMYFHLAFGRGHNIKLQYKKGDIMETVVENMPLKEYRSYYKSAREEREKKLSVGEPYSYKKMENGVGLINIYGFSAPDIDAYNIFLSKTFKKINQDNLHSLIIDVRGNYGGWPKIASELFHYISDGHFKTMAKSRMKVSQPYKEYFENALPARYRYDSQISFGAQRRHYVDIEAVLRNSVGTYVEEAAFFNEAPIDEVNEFKGDVYVLMDRDSYSAASSFASTIQCYSMGMLIGEETGGTKIFRANPIGKELYRSGIGVRLSTTLLYTACATDEGQGVVPHIEYSPNIFQLVGGVDTHMIFAERVIKKVQKKKEEEAKVIRP